MRNAITQARLKGLLDYEPGTGHFVWREQRNGAAGRGMRAGREKHNGYRVIVLDQICYREHRLAFLYMTGEFPPEDVDHINGNRNDNRWCNLRPATRAENCQNQARRSNNASGHTGVHRHSQNGTWIAQITVLGRKQHLGSFASVAEAKRAYVRAKARLHQFQPNERAA